MPQTLQDNGTPGSAGRVGGRAVRAPSMSGLRHAGSPFPSRLCSPRGGFPPLGSPLRQGSLPPGARTALGRGPASSPSDLHQRLTPGQDFLGATSRPGSACRDPREARGRQLQLSSCSGPKPWTRTGPCSGHAVHATAEPGPGDRLRDFLPDPVSSGRSQHRVAPGTVTARRFSRGPYPWPSTRSGAPRFSSLVPCSLAPVTVAFSRALGTPGASRPRASAPPPPLPGRGHGAAVPFRSPTVARS